ncbi:tetratricopeptide (TPR) repeat protein [Parabacteroides sp. PM6-13]|uniref:tetratricopeptide repeat protein n=1 Tax=Parabacteroides sp. PM6-13 TaxID=1742408 RepID=UPI002475F771|nr:tetratricopeptide repeat protein [Parabacteroides sp. PM6-13]MDH6343204.1 tetratricopeptide (TPR) repeat protein [Parabacteroides sp. PM6-13]
MKNKPVLLLLLFAVCLFSCREDAPSQALLDQAKAWMNEHPDSALWLLENDILPERLSARQQADWALFLTQARDKNYQTHANDSLIRLAVNYYEKQPNPERLMMAYYSQGRIYQNNGDALQAQEFYLKALDAGGTDHAILARICNNLGMLYTYQEAYELALPQMKRAIDHLQQIGDSASQAFVLRDMGRTYYQMDSLEQAIASYQQALQVASASSRASVMQELGSCFIDTQQYDSAYVYISAALQNSSHFHRSFPVYLTLGKYYIEVGNTDSAHYYLQKSLDSPTKNTRASAYYHLSRIARQNQQWEELSLLKDQYEALRDSITEQNHAESIRRMQHLYDYKLVENEANLYKYKHLASQRKMYVLILSSFLIAFFCLLLYIYFHKKHNEWVDRFQSLLNKLEEKEQEKASNKERIQDLEESLTMEENQEDDLFLLEKQILELKNSLIDLENKEKQELDALLHNTSIYHFYQNTANLGTITNENKMELIQTIDMIYPAFKTTLTRILPVISEKELELCYYIKAEISQANISKISAVSVSGIAMRQKRLLDKIQNRGFDANDLKRVIRAIY